MGLREYDKKTDLPRLPCPLLVAIVYRARGDLTSVLLVPASYLLLLLLFRRGQGPPDMERARRAVWLITALLTLGFA